MSAKTFNPEFVLSNVLCRYTLSHESEWDEFTDIITDAKYVFKIVEFVLLEKNQRYVLALTFLLFNIPRYISIQNNKLDHIAVSILKRKLPYMDFQDFNEYDTLIILDPLSKNDPILKKKIIELIISETKSTLDIIIQCKHNVIKGHLINKIGILQEAIDHCSSDHNNNEGSVCG